MKNMSETTKLLIRGTFYLSLSIVWIVVLFTDYQEFNLMSISIIFVSILGLFASFCNLYQYVEIKFKQSEK